jgi:hypothetical protein
MSSDPTPTDLETKAALHGEDALYFRHILIELVNKGAEICRVIVQQVKAEAEAKDPAAEPAPDYTLRFCRVSRSIRQSMMYCQQLTGSSPQADAAGPRRVAARKQVIRAVEDAIHRDAPADEVETLRSELAERMEGPEFDDDLDGRPIEEIVNAIRADLGIRGRASAEQWPRRMPEDILVLSDRAAAPCRAPGVTRLPPQAWMDPGSGLDPVEGDVSGWDEGPRIRGP